MKKSATTGLAIFGVFVLIIIVAELFFRGVIQISNSIESGGLAGVDPGAPAFADADYDPTDLLTEAVASGENLSYQPYIVWSRRSSQGHLTNVDEQGNRVTLNNSPDDDALQVWMFGGSAMWGFGASDEETIPSQLSRLLNREWGVDAKVTNFGEAAFVSTQEMIYLLRELQLIDVLRDIKQTMCCEEWLKTQRNLRQPPDIVVFFGGITDAAAVVESQGPLGSHISIARIRDKLERGGNLQSGVIENDTQIKTIIRSMALFRAARFAANKVGVEIAANTVRAEDHQFDKEVPVLAQKALSQWLENRRIVSVLSQEYNFNYIFALQPALWFEGKPLEASETELLESAKDGERRLLAVRAELSALLEAQLLARELDDVYNLGSVFQNVSEPLYIDTGHVTARGNQILSQVLFNLIRTNICNQPPPLMSELSENQLAAACR